MDEIHLENASVAEVEEAIRKVVVKGETMPRSDESRPKDVDVSEFGSPTYAFGGYPE
jgi:hypothetical protein